MKRTRPKRWMPRRPRLGPVRTVFRKRGSVQVSSFFLVGRSSDLGGVGPRPRGPRVRLDGTVAQATVRSQSVLGSMRRSSR
eukprot:485612-Pyramimonas_sp.AAC.1